jgi:hypothetical protein
VQVIFERVDERRYRIGVKRDGRHDVGADVPLRGAPGNADVPHDLIHFVVEEQAGLKLGIFGQVAAGGDCGGFFTPAPGDRRPATDAKRSARVGRAGRPDVAISERLAAMATHGVIADTDTDTDTDTDNADTDLQLRAAINRRLTEVLSQWRDTPAAGRLVLAWSETLTIRNGRIPAR